MIQHMQFTKLFNSILDSTIWQEPLETKVVWITMLAMCDRTGEVHASVPGLAKRAGVTLQQCNAALACLESPDEYSRTKTHDGRRIREIDGGWELLNHAKYRALLSAEERREYNKNKQAQYRAEKAEREKCKNVNDMSMTVNDNVSNAHITEAEAEAEAYTDTKKDKKTAPPLPLPFDSADFKLFWSNWEQHRKEKKAKLTPTARNQQLEKLKDMGEHRAIAALKHSLANGWTGIFEPEQSKSNGQHKGIEEIIPLRRL